MEELINSAKVKNDFFMVFSGRFFANYNQS
ncbi:Uncharacterised protein [Vibrio cholerae]|nr:Uncharacterised protein [Vibrio cholerae]